MSLQEKLNSLDALYEEIEGDIAKKKSIIKQRMVDLENQEMFGSFETEMVQQFLDKPYVILPRGTKTQEWLMIVPKFFDFNVGWLLQSTDSYNVFVVNKYADYLGAVPKEFQSLFKFRPRMPLKVFDGVMLTGEDHQDAAWEVYKRFLSARKGTDTIRIKKGRSFDLIAALIDDGILPFMRKPVADEHRVIPHWHTDLMTDEQRENVSMRMDMDFFKDAYKKFLSTGAVGIYWATGVGKTLIGLQALSAVKVDDRPNVVISGTSAALQLQWQQRLNSVKLAAKTIVVPFQSWHKIKDLDVGVLVIDECHHLPANSFSKIATMNCEYRMGLSATPYREDGRSDYIFALTGFPIGLDWKVLIDLGLIIEPEITLYLSNNYTQKRRKLAELLRDPLKTLIYCFSVKEGKSLSREFSIPFVYGDTPVKERLEIVKNSHQTIVSSAMGEGISVRDIQRTVTYNFLFGSRQEETQFFGRLLHGVEKGSHVILMTDDEYERYGKRLYGIQEKGFKIAVIRVGGSVRASRPKSRPKPRPRLETRARIDTVFPASHFKSGKDKPALIVDRTQYPLLDERDEFGREMVLQILRSDFAKSKGGLSVGEIRDVLDHHQVKYGGYNKFKDAIRTFYNHKDRLMSRRKDGNKRRYFVTGGD